MSGKDVWVVASFTCKEGKVEELLKHLKVLVDEVQKEPGCIKYDCYQDAKNPLDFTFIEHWESQEALDVHGNAAALRKWRPVSEGLRTSAPKVQVLNAIDF